MNKIYMNKLEAKIKEYEERTDKAIERLNKELEVTTTNEETFRLEMQEITKILGLDEHTIFDEVKEYARNLVKDNEMYSQLKDTNEEELRQEIDENYKLSELWLQSQNEVKRLNNIINKAIKKLSSAVNHFHTQRENNVITFTLKILKGNDKDE